MKSLCLRVEVFLLQDRPEVYFQSKKIDVIYLTNTDEMQAVWFPIPTTSAAVSVTLDLHSTTGLEDVIVTASGTSVPGYFITSLNPYGLALTPGEWEYTMTARGERLASGVLTVMSDELEYRKIYDKNISYEQYRAEEE